MLCISHTISVLKINHHESEHSPQVNCMYMDKLFNTWANRWRHNDYSTINLNYSDCQSVPSGSFMLHTKPLNGSFPHCVSQRLSDLCVICSCYVDFFKIHILTTVNTGNTVTDSNKSFLINTQENNLQIVKMFQVTGYSLDSNSKCRGHTKREKKTVWSWY